MKSEQGFTTIEIVVIIIIVIILSLTVFPQFSSFDTIKLNAVSRKIVSDIRYAQQLSMTTFERHGISFNVAGDSYIIYENGDPTDPAVNPEDQSDFNIDFDDIGAYEGVTISFASFYNGLVYGSIVEFDNLGIPYDDSNNALADDLAATNDNTIIITDAGGGSKTIMIEPGTGMVTVQ